VQAKQIVIGQGKLLRHTVFVRLQLTIGSQERKIIKILHSLFKRESPSGIFYSAEMQYFVNACYSNKAMPAKPKTAI